MGKIKARVLMAFIVTILSVLLVVTVFPSFALGKAKVKVWNPVVKQYDLGADLDGGYYAYYYPTGVISETEYKNLDGKDKEDYVNHKGLYLNEDPNFGIITEDGTISKDFEENFAKATKEITARYAAKGYSDYRISVVDDYALCIQIPSSEKTEQQTAFQNAYNTFGLFAETGALEIKKGDALVDERVNDEYKVNELIKEFSVYTKYEVAYIQIKFTDAGKEMIKSYKESGSQTTDETTGQTTDSKLKILLGDQDIMTIEASDEHITSKNVVRYPIAMETEVGYVETMVILLNSVLNNGSFDVEFDSVSNSQVREFKAVYGENTLLLVYIALAVILVGLMVFTIAKTGGFGASSALATITYLIIAAMCYAFISGGVFEVTLGSILVFLLVAVLMNALNVYIYGAIKNEFQLGKTVESAVKSGYRKTMMMVIDVYAVLLLGSAALLIGIAGLNTLAMQALICVAAGAFCSLLWTRVINAIFLSGVKNKYKYLRCVREDDDDE